MTHKQTEPHPPMIEPTCTCTPAETCTCTHVHIEQLLHPRV